MSWDRHAVMHVARHGRHATQHGKKSRVEKLSVKSGQIRGNITGRFHLSTNPQAVVRSSNSPTVQSQTEGVFTIKKTWSVITYFNKLAPTYRVTIEGLF